MNNIFDEIKNKKGKEFSGPPQHFCYHYLAATYKPSSKNINAYNVYMHALTKLYNCELCRVNLTRNLQNLPINGFSQNSQSLLYWSYVLHDTINREISMNGHTTKISPPLDDVFKYYSNLLRSSDKGRKIYERMQWISIHSLAVSYRPSPENAQAFKDYIHSIITLNASLGSKLLKYIQTIPIDRYLDNNHNLFYWTYLIRHNILKDDGQVSPPYDDVKAFYFKSLNEDCKECKIID